MKVSCIPICFIEDIVRKRTMSLSDWIAMAADVGLDAIEMYRPFLQDGSSHALGAVADEVEQAGLAISMYTSYAELAAPTAEERLRQVWYLKNDVDIAVALRTNIVRVTSGKWPQGVPREEALRNVADCLRRALDHAERKGVMLALEDHPQIGTRIEDFTEILTLVNDPRLKVNLDTSNPMEAGESAVDLVKLVKEKVVHVHASDRNERLEHQVVGEGIVPFPEIFAVLKTAGFDGWISLEAGGTKGKQGIIAGIEYVKRVWAKA